MVFNGCLHKGSKYFLIFQGFKWLFFVISVVLLVLGSVLPVFFEFTINFKCSFSLFRDIRDYGLGLAVFVVDGWNGVSCIFCV